MIIAGIDFRWKKVVKIPVWATAIHSISNSIDGWAPYGDQVFRVDAFIAKAMSLQVQHGGGEWAVLVYAASDKHECSEIHPYGRDNPYRHLRSTKGQKVQRIAEFTYMRWNFYTFTREP